MQENMKFWNTFNQPPKTALKVIEAGRMKGKTDINPQWRYKAMTQTFGPVGIGWKFTIDKSWTEPAAKDEVMVFVNVSVYVMVDGKWSDAIPGTGGSTLVVSESKGMYNDDDAYKKATTDALSTALKMLGVASDIYENKWDGAKYRDVEEPKKQEESKPQKTHRQGLIERYGKVYQRAQAVKIPLDNYQLNEKLTDDEIEKLGIELNNIVTAKEKAGK